ncbi:hypothetical protein [Kitasatospora sp. MBT66]|uniref:hypothetical protein n=1 Tax=Kitasatospora sp. MBT66 TaxID=1444769 RepID=UPI001E520976|nr:hypothetical protein [Kitasatospora sp. MBT66]
MTYIESAAVAVANGEPFERIRLSVLDRAERIARNSDHDGTFDSSKWEKRRQDPMSYVHNTVDVLKELMRLGWVERHVLPSTPRSAYAHAHVTYETTPAGLAWTDLVKQDQVAGYNALVGALLKAHPQFEGFLRLVGSRPDSTADHLTVPLLRTDGSSELGDSAYLTAFVGHVVEAARTGDLGWSEEPEIIEHRLRTYVDRALERWAARAKQRAAKEDRTPERPTTRKRLVMLCEEATVRLAFTAAGCPMDYISHELLRRWTRSLGLANFSYYAPGPHALRLWATGTVSGTGDQVAFRRTVGPQVRQSVLAALPRIWSTEEGLLDDATYHPVWRVRAAVCWELRISDEEFDAAIAAAYHGELPDPGFRIHLDEASQLRTPGSVRPLVLPSSTGQDRVFHVMSLYSARRAEEVASG